MKGKVIGLLLRCGAAIPLTLADVGIRPIRVILRFNGTKIMFSIMIPNKGSFN
jgi:hypothetical protein